MSAKAIREATGKDILNRHLGNVAGAAPCKFAAVTSETNWSELVQQNPWLETTVSNFILFYCLCYSRRVLQIFLKFSSALIYVYRFDVTK